MNRFLKIGIVLGLTACISGIAYAQMKPETAIRARQSIMRVMVLNFGPIAQMAQGKVAFNKGVFTANALRLIVERSGVDHHHRRQRQAGRGVEDCGLYPRGACNLVSAG